jgi:hypothetical protein
VNTNLDPRIIIIVIILLASALLLRNEELCDLYFSPNIIRVIKSRRLRWAEHVARLGREEVHREFWWGILREVAT